MGKLTWANIYQLLNATQLIITYTLNYNVNKKMSNLDCDFQMKSNGLFIFIFELLNNSCKFALKNHCFSLKIRAMNMCVEN